MKAESVVREGHWLKEVFKTVVGALSIIDSYSQWKTFESYGDKGWLSTNGEG
jgi:hypothetical protein